MANQIVDSWSRISAWLQANAPSGYALLQPPVSTEELDGASAHFGIELPDDFTGLYQLVNGTDPNGESVGVFPSEDEWDDMAFGPLALAQIIHEWNTQKELVEISEFADLEPQSANGVANDWWNVKWIPFASNGGGDFYCIDMAPTGAGTVGQIITHSHESGQHEILAPSLATYLSELADGLEAGQFEYTEDGLVKIKANE